MTTPKRRPSPVPALTLCLVGLTIIEICHLLMRFHVGEIRAPNPLSRRVRRRAPAFGLKLVSSTPKRQDRTALRGTRRPRSAYDTPEIAPG